MLTLLCMLARGLGQGATGIPSISAAYASIPRERLSFATTAMSIVQRIGGPVATTLVAIVTALAVGHGSDPAPGAFFGPFVALELFQLAALASVLRSPGRTPVRV